MNTGQSAWVRGGAIVALLAGGMVAEPVQGAPPKVEYQVFAYNDLGMHCFDSDFSVFSLLPPFNVLQAQVVKKGKRPVLCTDRDVSVVDLGAANSAGSINTTSLGKTHFWQFVGPLYGLNPAPDVGLLGAAMPGPANQPRTMTFDRVKKLAAAAGIPITDVDNTLQFEPYPVMRIQAKPKGKTNVVSSIDIVVPVSSEMDCKTCHANGGKAASDLMVDVLGLTLSTQEDLDLQARENILRLHDVLYQTQLWNRRPVLCASCHYSKALDLAGTGPKGAQLKHAYLSRAMHLRHGKTFDNQLPTADKPPIIREAGVDTCYKCHPGNVTNCLRSVMSDAHLVCQNCHGGMLAVGGQFPLRTGKTREPWTDLPKCQSCHTGDLVSNVGGGPPRTVAFDPADPAATPILAPKSRFAENANQLYRFSKGHGGMTCAACHGSPHAEWPARSPAADDNLAAMQIQGHEGPALECQACHTSDLPPTTAGPHGMHNVNSLKWVKEHGSQAKRNRFADCQACHGLQLEGTALSNAGATRVFKVEHKTVTIPQGSAVSCTLCHENPLYDEDDD